MDLDDPLWRGMAAPSPEPFAETPMEPAATTTTHHHNSVVITQQQQQQHLPAPTRVNGVGLWNSWTRNFKTPMLAFLDLMDNAVDAADVLSTTGKIEISADQWVPDAHATTRCGLVLMNNSQNACKDISQILEVYHSTKSNAAETVGENGVGLKQGCAALANLSFIVTRNQDDLYLGLLARRLQRPEGVCLPSWHLGRAGVDNPEAMVTSAAQLHEALADCLAEYGGGSLLTGTQRLVGHLQRLLEHPTWAQETHVFMLILNQLVHGNQKKKPKAEPKTGEAKPGIVAEASLKPPPVAAAQVGQQEGPTPDVAGSSQVMPPQAAQRPPGEMGQGATERQEPSKPPPPELPVDVAYVRQFMKDLSEILPRQYIHIPSSFYLRIDGKPVQFEFWQRRLVEMTQFQVQVVKSESFLEDTWGWRDVIHRQPDEWYNLNVYVGFDAERSQQKNQGMAQLIIYSRQSGRHIMHIDDARSTLFLPVGGSDFCQGLTVIVDDHDGKLPLNPTKQDLAFGEEEHGESHKINLFGWIGAVAWTYWRKCCDFCGGSKEILSERVKNAMQKPDDSGTIPLPLRQSKFSKFLINNRADWKADGATNKKARIRPVNRGKTESEHGPQTLFRLDRSMPDEIPEAKNTPKKRKYGTINTPIDIIDDDDDDDNTTSNAVGNNAPIPRAAKSSAAAFIADQVQSEVGVNVKEKKWRQRAGERAQRIKQLEEENKRLNQSLQRAQAQVSSPARGNNNDRSLALEIKVKLLQQDKEAHLAKEAAWEEERAMLKNQLASARSAVARAVEKSAEQKNSEQLKKSLDEMKKYHAFEKAEKKTLLKQNETLQQENDRLQRQLAKAEQLTRAGRREVPSTEDVSSEEEW